MPESIITIHDSFDVLTTDSRDRFNNDEGGDFFSSLPWYRNLTETVFSHRDDIRIHVLRSDGEPDQPVLILPLRQTRSAGPLNLRTLAPLANFYTSLFNVIPASDHRSADQHIAQWVESLANHPHYDQINLFPLSTDSALYRAGGKALESAGYIVQRYFCFGNWYLKVRGRSYADYVKELPSALRHTISRKSRQLESMPGLRLAILSAPEQASEGAKAFDHVVRSSWKSPEPFPQFVPGLLRTCAEQGCLRMGVAYLHDKPIAFQIWFVYRKTASIYKLAYDDAHAKLSVGTVLTAMLMRRVIDEDRVTEVDYLNGDERYKQDWMSDRRERYGIVAFNTRTFRGALGAVWNVLGRQIRKIKSRKK